MKVGETTVSLLHKVITSLRCFKNIFMFRRPKPEARHGGLGVGENMRMVSAITKMRIQAYPAPVAFLFALPLISWFRSRYLILVSWAALPSEKQLQLTRRNSVFD